MDIRDFILTGTQVYGVAKKDSDIDIVLKVDDVYILEKELDNKGITVFRTEVQEHREYSGFYFRLGIMTFNIICVVNNEHMHLWKHATECMRGIPPIQDRGRRIEAFHRFYYDEKRGRW